ncbi:MAG: aldehyde dehydrogenase family protein [Candidatus Acidiferrales bacterium]
MATTAKNSIAIDRPDFQIRPGKLYINGSWKEARDGKTRSTINPCTEAEITQIAQATVADVDEAIQSARKAFDSGPWPRLQPHERARIMFKIAELIDKNADELAYREVIDMGMLWRDARDFCAPFVAECFRYYGGWCTKMSGAVPIAEPGRIAFTIREPLGVVAAITPFNVPMVLSTFKLAPALACGNTIIHKPASITPLTAIKMAEIFEEAELPKGVFNLITGPGGVVGQQLVTSPMVDKIGVTGSTAVGKQIIKDAADTLKHVTAELGGKSPDIVFADADLDLAIEAAAQGAFGNKGEQCFGGTRLLVEKSIHDEVVERLKAKIADMRVGDPFDPETAIGPVADKSEYDKVLGYIKIGREQDHVRVVSGGKRSAHQNGKGYFVDPTLMVHANNAMRVAQEEIFGPVLTVIPFSTFDEAIKIANDIPYGLAAGVHTRDMKKALAATRAIQAGVVWINTYGQFDFRMPFGGVKESGIGRELGPDVLDHYMQTKAVWLYAV